MSEIESEDERWMGDEEHYKPGGSCYADLTNTIKVIENIWHEMVVDHPSFKLLGMEQFANETFTLVMMLWQTLIIEEMVAEELAEGKVEQYSDGQRAATIDTIKDIQHTRDWEYAQTDEALDDIYRFINAMLKRENYGHCNMFLKIISGHADTIPKQKLIAALTASLPAKSHLADREELYRKTEEVLKKRSEYNEGTLRGLE